MRVTRMVARIAENRIFRYSIINSPDLPVSAGARLETMGPVELSTRGLAEAS
jgi:hypothetical protein